MTKRDNQSLQLVKRVQPDTIVKRTDWRHTRNVRRVLIVRPERLPRKPVRLGHTVPKESKHIHFAVPDIIVQHRDCPLVLLARKEPIVRMQQQKYYVKPVHIITKQVKQNLRLVKHVPKDTIA